MQVKSIADCSKRSLEHSAILSTFNYLPCVIKTFVLSIFEWPFTQVLLYVRSEGSGKADHMRRLIRALATCGCNKYLNLTCWPIYSKTCVKRPLSERPKIGFHDQLSLNAGQKYCRMLQGDHSTILSTFIKLPLQDLSLRPLFCLLMSGHYTQVQVTVCEK